MRMLILIAFLTLHSGSDTTRVLRLHLPDGIETLQYDTRLVKESDIRRWAQLSKNVAHYNGYLVPEGLALCTKDDPAYVFCGSRDLKDPNFVRNANANLSKIRNRIDRLKGTDFPEELKPVVSYFLRIQEAFLSLYEHELKFLQTRDFSQLSQGVDGMDPQQECSATLGRIRQARDGNEIFILVGTDLQNCVNQQLRQRLGDYPDVAWHAFLDKHSIVEKFAEKDVS